MQNFFETGKLPLFAADFEYYRLPPKKWDLMLIRLKQMGANAIIIPLPWSFHEFNRGTVDLAGVTNPRRNVTRVLNLCQALNLPGILELGPYNHRALLNDGLPLWLSNDADDLELVLPAAVEGWVTALSKVLSSQQWPAGPIIALQIDSETPKGQQPAPSEQVTEVKWPIWLRKRYNSIDALNAAYGTDYRTVNQVKFPQTWTEASTSLEKDAKEFLDEIRQGIHTNYIQTLVETGWQIPIFPSTTAPNTNLPAIQRYSLTNMAELPAQNLGNTLLHLQHAVQVDPDPVDLGQTPTWAENAPIRIDGSLRRTFWSLRQLIWTHTLPEPVVEDRTLVATFDGVNVVTCSHDILLKLDVPTGTKPAVYRLRINGDLVVDEPLKVRRGKLSGPYQAEDETDQTDLLFLFTDPTKPLTGFPLAYLADLLTAQFQSLTESTALAEQLGQQLTLTSDTSDPDTARYPAHTLSSLEEARRGLREADAALRKAMSSISGLEHGFATILDKDQASAVPQPATATAIINPEIFDGPARETLLGIGGVCKEIVPQLESAITTLEGTLDTTNGFTLEQYRQSYATAIATAQSVRKLLLEIITRLRLEIGSERLPFITWRVHDQVQEIAETLRWGVLRK